MTIRNLINEIYMAPIDNTIRFSTLASMAEAYLLDKNTTETRDIISIIKRLQIIVKSTLEKETVSQGTVNLYEREKEKLAKYL